MWNIQDEILITSPFCRTDLLLWNYLLSWTRRDCETAFWWSTGEVPLGKCSGEWCHRMHTICIQSQWMLFSLLCTGICKCWNGKIIFMKIQRSKTRMFCPEPDRVTSSCQVRIFHVRFSLLNSPASGVLLALRVDHSEGLIQHVHSIDTIWTPNESSIFSIKVNLREYFSVSGLQQMEMIHWFS